MSGFQAIGEAAMLRTIVGAPAHFTAGLTQAAHMCGQLLVRRTQQGIVQGPHSGRTYPGMNQSSAPGEYPANQSGQLLGSIGYEVSGRELRFGSEGATNRGFDYAVGLHEGTSKMAPRPYLTKAYEENAAAMETMLGQVTWRYIVGGG